MPALIVREVRFNSRVWDALQHAAFARGRTVQLLLHVQLCTGLTGCGAELGNDPDTLAAAGLRPQRSMASTT